MRFFSQTIAILTLFTSQISLALIEPTERPAPIKRVFVPAGFDDNDLAEVVIQGVFPTSCFRLGQSGFEVDQSQNRIEVWASAYEYSAGTCADVQTSFIIPLKVGILKEGSYEIRLRGDSTTIATLKIGKAVSESADDFLYAPVEGANVKFDSAIGTQSLRIFGRLPLSKRGCLILREVRMNPVENDVLVVLPIMAQLDGEACNGVSSEFDVTVPLTTALKGDKLIHIRSINGDSYNNFANFGPVEKISAAPF
jgi:hypothetical protein